MIRQDLLASSAPASGLSVSYGEPVSVEPGQPVTCVMSFERKQNGLSERPPLTSPPRLRPRNPKAENDYEDENDADSINKNKIFVSIQITG